MKKYYAAIKKYDVKEDQLVEKLYIYMYTYICICVSLIAQLYPTLWKPMDCSPPRSSIHRIIQARILELIAISFSRGSSQLRDQTQVSHIAGGFFTIWATREAHRYTHTHIYIFKFLKEQNFAICGNMDGHAGHYAKWNKSEGERQILYDIT